MPSATDCSLRDHRRDTRGAEDGIVQEKAQVRDRPAASAGRPDACERSVRRSKPTGRTQRSDPTSQAW
jgi:hypothetical protein